MARRTFFRFHYEIDVWRASVVRNSAKPKASIDTDFIDASLWKESKLKGNAALQRLIDNALVGTSVTAVLIGSHTSKRPWVKYEIDKSVERRNGLLGIRINNIKDKDGNTSAPGNNPLTSEYRIYDWINNDGYSNLGSWVELAYKER